MVIFYIPLVLFLIFLVLAAREDEKTCKISNARLFFFLFLYGLFTLFCSILAKKGRFPLAPHVFVRIWLGRLLSGGLGLVFFVILSLISRKSMGMGDAKMLALLLLYTGLFDGLFIMALAFFFTLCRAFANRLKSSFYEVRRKKSFPFAPQLALSYGLVFILKLVRFLL